MKLPTHPSNVKPTRAGYSIGRWDVLVVDTVKFLPGVLNAPVLNSDQLHVVERFSLDPKTMALTRSFIAEPGVFAGQVFGLGHRESCRSAVCAGQLLGAGSAGLLETDEAVKRRGEMGSFCVR